MYVTFHVNLNHFVLFEHLKMFEKVLILMEFNI